MSPHTPGHSHVAIAARIGPVATVGFRAAKGLKAEKKQLQEQRCARRRRAGTSWRRRRPGTQPKSSDSVWRRDGRRRPTSSTSVTRGDAGGGLVATLVDEGLGEKEARVSCHFLPKILARVENKWSFFAVPANFPDTQVGEVTELKAREQRGWPGSNSKHACASMLLEKQQNYDASYMNAVGEAAELKR